MKRFINQDTLSIMIKNGMVKENEKKLSLTDKGRNHASGIAKRIFVARKN